MLTAAIIRSTRGLEREPQPVERLEGEQSLMVEQVTFSSEKSSPDETKLFISFPLHMDVWPNGDEKNSLFVFAIRQNPDQNLDSGQNKQATFILPANHSMNFHIMRGNPQGGVGGGLGLQLVVQVALQYTP